MATIPEYYQDKVIFITGATGFIGKVLVEKLLRSCPEIQAIYCLTRPKQGEAAADRLNRMLSEPVSFGLSSFHVCVICELVLYLYIFDVGAKVLLLANVQ